ncbi:MAG: hypothetical protein ABJN62_13130 [Halioglobus sp.]
MIARQQLIAHSGGAFGDKKYTNSLEAITYSTQYTNLIELDAVLCADDLLIAHDGLERHYGIEGNFSGITKKGFSSCRYMKKLTPLSFGQLAELSIDLNAKIHH